MSALVNYTYWKWDAVLSKEFCNFMITQFDWNSAEDGTIYLDKNSESTGINPNIRVTDVIWQDPRQPLGCISKTYIGTANKLAGWDYHISGQENTQIARYRGENNGHYDWHTDTSPPIDAVQRKLSCVILLNDPSEFEGGTLQFRGMEDQNVLDQQGSIIVFPSFIEHRVTRVTSGVRYTAATWVQGPAFK